MINQKGGFPTRYTTTINIVRANLRFFAKANTELAAKQGHGTILFMLRERAYIFVEDVYTLLQKKVWKHWNMCGVLFSDWRVVVATDCLRSFNKVVIADVVFVIGREDDDDDDDDSLQLPS